MLLLTQEVLSMTKRKNKKVTAKRKMPDRWKNCLSESLVKQKKQLKNGWLKRIKIGSAVSSTECYCGTFLYLPVILAG